MTKAEAVSYFADDWRHHTECCQTDPVRHGLVARVRDRPHCLDPQHYVWRGIVSAVWDGDSAEEYLELRTCVACSLAKHIVKEKCEGPAETSFHKKKVGVQIIFCHFAI